MAAIASSWRILCKLFQNIPKRSQVRVQSDQRSKQPHSLYRDRNTGFREPNVCKVVLKRWRRYQISIGCVLSTGWGQLQCRSHHTKICISACDKCGMTHLGCRTRSQHLTLHMPRVKFNVSSNCSSFQTKTKKKKKNIRRIRFCCLMKQYVIYCYARQ